MSPAQGLGGWVGGGLERCDGAVRQPLHHDESTVAELAKIVGLINGEKPSSLEFIFCTGINADTER